VIPRLLVDNTIVSDPNYSNPHPMIIDPDPNPIIPSTVTPDFNGHA